MDETKRTSDIDDRIFEFVYVTAMKDATGQKAYEAEKKWLNKLSDIDGLKSVLNEHIDKVINGEIKDQDEYNDLFKKTVISVCECINKKAKKRFTFGNAQKLVNMMLKYFYIMCYGDRDRKDSFKYCHCPMDQNMLGLVWEEYNKLLNADKSFLGTKTEFTASWGKLDFDIVDEKEQFPERYRNFQTAVREIIEQKGLNCSILEFDYLFFQ